jgi:hypothetical protein
MAPPLRKVDPLLLTKADPRYAHSSVDNGELKDVIVGGRRDWLFGGCCGGVPCADAGLAVKMAHDQKKN